MKHEATAVRRRHAAGRAQLAARSQKRSDTSQHANLTQRGDEASQQHRAHTEMMHDTTRMVDAGWCLLMLPLCVRQRAETSGATNFTAAPHCARPLLLL